MTETVQLQDVYVYADQDRRKVVVDFNELPLGKINSIGRLNGKPYDFREIGLLPAINEFITCVRKTVEDTRRIVLSGKVVEISIGVGGSVSYIRDQIKSLLRINGLSVP